MKISKKALKKVGARVYRGGVYNGECRNGKPSGFGTMEFKRYGTFFEGYWNNGVEHGQGLMTFRNGRTYEGMFDKGVPVDGVLRNANNTILFRGGFNIDWSYRLGTLYMTDGSVYIGYFAANLPHGRGKMIYPNGDQFYGTFRFGIKHGRGRYRKVITGNWRNGNNEELDLINNAVANHDELVILQDSMQDMALTIDLWQSRCVKLKQLLADKAGMHSIDFQNL